MLQLKNPDGKRIITDKRVISMNCKILKNRLGNMLNIFFAYRIIPHCLQFKINKLTFPDQGMIKTWFILNGGLI